MKKKIAIITNKMEMGGCEKALISMLKEIDFDLYDITLYVRESGGVLQQHLPRQIKVKEIVCGHSNINNIIRYYFINRRYWNIIKAIYYRIKLKISTKKEYYLNYVKMLPNIEEKYDLAISYFFPGEFAEWYVINNINAIKKCVWIHSDIEKIETVQNKKWKKMYMNYDKIICISQKVKDGFLRYSPECCGKLEVIYNFLNKEEIIKKSSENKKLDENYSGIKLLTVGRLSKEKGQLQIPYIVNRLLKDNIDIKWYCIGDGSLKNELKDEIKKYNVQEKVILLGPQINPYPLIKDCDIYIQPSIYEGYCISLAEAKILNKPIITTNFAGADEQIVNYKNGIITEINKDKLYMSIKQLILQKDMQQVFKHALRKEYENVVDYKIDIFQKLL